MFTDEVPVCDRCLHRSDTAKRLNQHAYTIKVSYERMEKTRGESRATGNISLHHPLDPRSDFSPRDPLKQPDSLILSDPQKEPSQLHDTLRRRPAWMNLLPSNVNHDVRPPIYPAMDRRLAFPYFQSTRLPAHFSTLPEHRISDSTYGRAMSKAMQGTPEESRSASGPSQAYLGRSLASPHSYAVAGSGPHKNVSHHQTTPKPTFYDAWSCPREPHEPSETPLYARTVRKPMTGGRRPLGISSRRSSKGQTSLRKYPSAQADAPCAGTARTSTHEQPVTPTKPAFYKELSSFFATRAGR